MMRYLNNAINTKKKLCKTYFALVVRVHRSVNCSCYHFGVFSLVHVALVPCLNYENCHIQLVASKWDKSIHATNPLRCRPTDNHEILTMNQRHLHCATYSAATLSTDYPKFRFFSSLRTLRSILLCSLFEFFSCLNAVKYCSLTANWMLRFFTLYFCCIKIFYYTQYTLYYSIGSREISDFLFRVIPISKRQCFTTVNCLSFL